MTQRLRLNIVSALNCEAKAMIDFFRLKKSSDRPFATFTGLYSHGDNKVTTEITALISGVGALNMATAVGWLAAQNQQSAESAQNAVWLNVGVAGHGEFELGDGFIVTAVQDLMSQRRYFPPQVARRPVKTSACMSLNAPSSDYPEDGAIDMEASAFFNAATRFSDAELVQSFKVVSDTPRNSAENLNAKMIQALLQPHTEHICSYIRALLELASALPQVPVGLNMPEMPATHSQKQQLDDRALRLTHVLSAVEQQALEAELAGVTDVKEALTRLAVAQREFEPRLNEKTHTKA